MTLVTPAHIGYLVQQFPPEVGAGPARVTEMALQWQDSGARVTVMTGMPNRPEGRIHAEYRGRLFMEEDWQGLRVLRSWLYASPKHGFLRTILNNATFMVTSAMNALVNAGDVDVVIASSPPFFPHLSGVVVAGVHRAPLVLEVRDLWPDYLVGMGVLKGRTAKALFALERWLLGRATHVVVVTESFRKRVIEKGVAPERVSVISNGVDTSSYYSADEPAPLPEMARRDGEFLVGYLGNFGAGQALSTVVEAAALLRDEPRVRFLLAGDGPDAGAVARRARELGLDNISIHPPIPKDRTRAFYNACDLCLVPLAPFPIFQETVPSKIFEIMACQRPFLASLSGEGARITMESGGGVVSEPGDASAMADAIMRILQMSDSERAALGTAGREYVSRHYDRHVLAERYLELLENVVRERHPKFAVA
jgi:glycosyltransferase involved in cell wall biosynthesis